jgi:PPK2 family polyphosphate:nucleotide phosphotransferase
MSALKMKAFARRFVVKPGDDVRLRKRDPNATFNVHDKEEGKLELERLTLELSELQRVLYAEGKHSVLVVLQAMDTGGKDGTIRHVFGPLNPQGVQVSSFKTPTAEELAHDFLWRIHSKTPKKGMIRIFNRSHYEDVLITRVHNLVPRKEIEARYDQINAFEKHLVDNGTTILKFCLNISKDEQKERLEARLARPDKNWKFSSADVEERKLWNDYQRAYEKALSKCSTPWAPWFVIPANRKWYRNYAISRIVLESLEGLKCRYPEPEEGLEQIVIGD